MQLCRVFMCALLDHICVLMKLFMCECVSLSVSRPVCMFTYIPMAVHVHVLCLLRVVCGLDAHVHSWVYTLCAPQHVCAHTHSTLQSVPAVFASVRVQEAKRWHICVLFHSGRHVFCESCAY